jgi:xylan 1,4-beta-xylosidase
MRSRRTLLGSALALLFASTLNVPALAADNAARRIPIDLDAPTVARDRFADLSVGADFPGTLIRDDSLAQLKTAKDELGFRYIRFHGIFHDVLGTYKVVGGKPVYDWTKIDYLYDKLLAIGIKPFVELGFTPEAMKTSDNSIFYWKGNTSHPDHAQYATCSSATAGTKCAPGSSRCGTSRTWTASGKRPTSRPILRCTT